VRAADFDYSGLRVDPSRLPARSYSLQQARRLSLLPGDLVLEKSGGGDQWPVGRAVLWNLEVAAVPTNFAARLRPVEDVDSRFLVYVAASLYGSGATARCIKQTTGIQNLDAEAWLETPTPLWPIEEQRRIADFLDDQVARLDAATGAARQMQALLEQRAVAAVTHRLTEANGRWRVDPSWSQAPVSAFFALDLGKMLNEERASGVRLRPYLRNTNVQWDRIDTSDLKEMHFEPGETRRYGLRTGDLLICEGGQPGRAAVWDGRVEEMYFQKALHRARPQGPTVLSRWLLHCLRVCVQLGAFADEGGTTIAHLTGEQLRELRLPFPPVQEQRALVEEFDGLYRQSMAAGEEAIGLQRLLEERKRALITACVTGEFDVSTASARAGDAALCHIELGSAKVQ
jgi:type I restriction enzyme S subunit